MHIYYSHVVLGWSYGTPKVRIMLITGQITSITLAWGLMYVYIVRLEGEQTGENNSG